MSVQPVTAADAAKMTPEAASAELASQLREWVIVSISSGRKLIGLPTPGPSGALLLSPAFEYQTGMDPQNNYHRRVMALEMFASASSIVVQPETIIQLATLSDEDRGAIASMVAAAVTHQKTLRIMRGAPSIVIPGGRA